ncbi:uncharacterized protein [Temnothorax longispinosus]|uniref:uncharacterized protein n=1 Tax=Temnothorax longispinosus TaxID=300112 RepID=UPI003A993302
MADEEKNSNVDGNIDVDMTEDNKDDKDDKDEVIRLKKENAQLRRQLAAIHHSPSPQLFVHTLPAPSQPSTSAPAPPTTPTSTTQSTQQKPKRWARAGRNRHIYARGRGRGGSGRAETIKTYNFKIM